MKYLLLDGHGIRINVDSGLLKIQNGRTSIEKEPEKIIIKPKMSDYDNIVVYGYNGYVTFEAMRWLTKMNVQLTLLDWNGRLLTSILPPEAKQIKLKFEQYRAYESSQRLDIAKNLINAKFKNSIVVLDWLKKKYPEIKHNVADYFSKLRKAKTIKEVMFIEGHFAAIYWKEISRIFKRFEFNGRSSKTKRPFGAVDPINSLFNYGYSLLESQCHRSINATGLDTHVGFMHEITHGKTPLVYDLQEPFRCLIDVAIITGLEKNVFKKSDFIRTENYNIRLRSSGAKKLIKEIEIVLNTRVFYRGMNRTWNYIIMLKGNEFGLYLQKKRKKLDFSDPSLNILRKDDYDLRQKILDIPYSKAKELGFSKGTLWYMKQNAKSDKPFKVYEKVRKRL